MNEIEGSRGLQDTNTTNLPHGRYLAGDLTLLASYEVVIVRQCTSGIAETEDG